MRAMSTVKGRFPAYPYASDRKSLEAWRNVVREGGSGRFVQTDAGSFDSATIEKVIAELKGARAQPGAMAEAPPADVAEQKARRAARIKAISELGIALHRETLAALAK